MIVYIYINGAKRETISYTNGQFTKTRARDKCNETLKSEALTFCRAPNFDSLLFASICISLCCAGSTVTGLGAPIV
eukprot:COSAG06_NODE_4250_length_4433_cov_1.907014_6_plen_76_part_00